MKVYKRLKKYFIKRLANALYSDIYQRIRDQSHIRIGKDGYIDDSALIQRSVVLGNVRIGAHSKIVEGALLQGKINIGRYTTINGPNTDIYARVNPVQIGSFCSIARNVAIQEYNHNYHRVSTYFFGSNIFDESIDYDIISKGEIAIGNDVWIGTQCVILSGVNIGHGAVIAANSIVGKDIPPYAIAAGSPAKVIKYRFDKPTIQNLLQIQWWEWPVDKIKQNREFFKCDITNIPSEELISLVI